MVQPAVDLNRIAKAFRLFNEKAEKLARLSFIKKMTGPDVGFKLTFNAMEDPPVVTQERRGADEEATDAFVLTFRFFIQDNEASSFRQMAEHYQAAPIDPALKGEFGKLREAINKYLDSGTNINYNNEHLTLRRIMDVCIYAGLSHGNNENKRRLYLTWVKDPFIGQFIQHVFLSILANIYAAILHIKKLNEKALEHLPGPS